MQSLLAHGDIICQALFLLSKQPILLGVNHMGRLLIFNQRSPVPCGSPSIVMDLGRSIPGCVAQKVLQAISIVFASGDWVGMGVDFLSSACRSLWHLDGNGCKYAQLCLQEPVAFGWE